MGPDGSSHNNNNNTHRCRLMRIRFQGVSRSSGDSCVGDRVCHRSRNTGVSSLAQRERGGERGALLSSASSDVVCAPLRSFADRHSISMRMKTDRITVAHRVGPCAARESAGKGEMTQRRVPLQNCIPFLACSYLDDGLQRFLGGFCGV